MAKKFHVGDAVGWSWATDTISGKVIEVHTQEIEFKGQTFCASDDEPYFEVRSDKTGATAVHKGDALKSQTFRRQIKSVRLG